MLKTASLLSTEQLSQQSGQWSCVFTAERPFMSLTNTHTHRHTHTDTHTHTLTQSPVVLHRLFMTSQRQFRYDLHSSLSSCLDSHLVCDGFSFLDEGVSGWGWGGAHLGGLHRDRTCGRVLVEL